ncbi:MAG: hypothetical protein QOF00_5459 [Pseudonocardiales bacterium]|nr:hypothetical protein [Pseudonocardiales bacterium]
MPHGELRSFVTLTQDNLHGCPIAGHRRSDMHHDELAVPGHRGISVVVATTYAVAVTG